MDHRAGRVTSLHQLKRLSENRRAVFIPGSMAWGKPLPAAFVIQLSGAMLINMMGAGLCLYNKDGKDGKEEHK